MFATMQDATWTVSCGLRNMGYFLLSRLEIFATCKSNRIGLTKPDLKMIQTYRLGLRALLLDHHHIFFCKLQQV